MNHFLANDWRRAHTLKRGGCRALIPLDDTVERRYALEAASDLTPEKMYERRWARSLFDRALGRLREQSVAAGKIELYEALKHSLAEEITPGDYERLAARLGMTRGALATAVHRLRRRCRQVVREEVAHTVADPADVEDEMRALLAALGS
jgi:RNA polymerase sigma-70 factor (ECF subfamily)